MRRLGWLVVLGLTGCGADAGPGGAMPMGVGLVGAGQAGAVTEALGGNGGGAAGAPGRQTALRPGGAGGLESWPASGGLSDAGVGGGPLPAAGSGGQFSAVIWCRDRGYSCGYFAEVGFSCGGCSKEQDCGVWGPGRCSTCQRNPDRAFEAQVCGGGDPGMVELWGYCGAQHRPDQCQPAPGEPLTQWCCPAGSVLP
jgi:hypothetical protein